MLSPSTIINDFSPDIEGTNVAVFKNEIGRIQSVSELTILVKSVIGRNILYQEIYNTNYADEIIRLISIDAFSIIENALKLKNIFIHTNSNSNSNSNSSTNTFQRINKNKNNLPFFNKIMACTLLMYISNNGSDCDNIFHNSLGDISYVRGRLVDFSIMGPGYWGDSDWGLERTIRNSINNVRGVFASAIERLGIFLIKSQVLIDWKISNPLSTQAGLMLFANSRLEKPKNIKRNSLPTDVSQIQFRPPPVSVCPSIGIPMGFFQSNMIAPPLPLVQPPPSIDLNLGRIPLTLPGGVASIYQDGAGPYSHISSNNKFSQFRKEASNICSRLNSYGASDRSKNRLVGLPTPCPNILPNNRDRVTTSNDDSLVILSSSCSLTDHQELFGFSDTITNTDSQEGSFNFLNFTSRGSRTPSLLFSDTESDTASKDSDGVSKNSSSEHSKSNIVRRGRKLLDKQSLPVFKMHAKGIQLTQHRSFRVQLNKTKNSSTKFTKNVDDFTEALWLFEIAVLICDQPTKLSTLLKSGNYDYLLLNNFVKNSTDYRALLGDNILKLQSKKILKKEQADLAVSIFGDLGSDSTKDHVVDPADLANLLSLKG